MAQTPPADIAARYLEPIDARPVPVVAAASASGGMTERCSTACSRSCWPCAPSGFTAESRPGRATSIMPSGTAAVLRNQPQPERCQFPVRRARLGSDLAVGSRPRLK